MNDPASPLTYVQVAAQVTTVKRLTYAYAAALAGGLHDEADKILCEAIAEGPGFLKMFVVSLTKDMLDLTLYKDYMDSVDPGTTLSQIAMMNASILETSERAIRIMGETD